MNYTEIIKKLDESKYLISMTPVEKIVETGYSLNLNEKTAVLDLCCGYGEMLKIWCEAFGIKGKGVDQCLEYIEKGNERLSAANIHEKITLIVDDI